jgi:putative ABC transport system substrate-binding protein
MKRRAFITAWGGAAVSLSALDGWAQRTIPLIGVLSPFNDATSTMSADFRDGLHEYGYIEGKNISIEYRSAEGQLELLPDLILDLLGRKADIIVTSSAPAVLAARQATSKTPVVFARVGDALAQGIITSLAHPGGNVTGISWFAPELTGKIIGLLKEAFPRISQVAIFREAAAGAASAVAANIAAQRSRRKFSRPAGPTN